MTEQDDKVEHLMTVMLRQQDTITKLTTGFDRMEKRVKALESALETQKAAQAKWSTIDWYQLTERQKGEHLAELAKFATELVSRYGLQDALRPCWWRHEIAREELTSLWAARKTAYAVNADQSMPSWWLDTLDRSQQRLRRITVRCRKHHQDPETDTWMPDEEQAALDRRIRQLLVSGDPVEVDTAGREQHG